MEALTHARDDLHRPIASTLVWNSGAAGGISRCANVSDDSYDAEQNNAEDRHACEP